MLKWYENVSNEQKKMENVDSLKISQNKDGSYTMDWDKEDPNWKWLNGLTSKEIQCIVAEAIRLDQNDRG